MPAPAVPSHTAGDGCPDCLGDMPDVAARQTAGMCIDAAAMHPVADEGAMEVRPALPVLHAQGRGRHGAEGRALAEGRVIQDNVLPTNSKNEVTWSATFLPGFSNSEATPAKGTQE